MIVYPANSAVSGVYVHIAPNFAVKAVCIGNFKHSFQVLGYYLRLVFQTVLFQIFSLTEHIRFVHADMNIARCKTFGKRSEHIFDQLVRAVLVHKQDIVDIFDPRIRAVSKNRAEMGKRLDTRNELHAVFCGVCVHPFQLCFGIPAAKISEIRLSVHLIRIFSIQTNCVIAERGKNINHFFKGGNRHNGIPRTIYHYAQFVKV